MSAKPPPPSPLAAAASSTGASSLRTRPRAKRPAGSSLDDDENEHRRIAMQTIRRRSINSPPKSVFKSPTPRRPYPQRPHLTGGGPAPISLSFNHDVPSDNEVDGTKQPPSSTLDAEATTATANVFRDDSDSDSSDASFVSGDSLGDELDEFNGSLFTQPQTQDILSTPNRGETANNDEQKEMHPPAGGIGYNASHTPDYSEIPQSHRDIITQAMKQDWGIDTPREFQIQAIYRGAFYDDEYIHMIAATGLGKSVVPLCIASLRRGVAVIEVPLLGLGSDQVAKALFVDKDIETYHVDEHKYSDASLLKHRLLSMTDEERKHVSVILFLSPTALAPNSEWTALLTQLAKKDYISLLAIDEAHYINLAGKSFRPEFVESVKTINLLHQLSTVKPPRIAMSATFRQSDQKALNELIGMDPDFLVWTNMNKRRIFFEVVVSGKPTTTCSSALHLDLRTDPTIKAIWYTNSKAKAEDSLVPSAENKLDKARVDGEAMALTGDCGIMEKSFLLAAFRGDEELFNRPQREELADLSIDDEMCDQPNLKVLAATEAANCGISSNKCVRGYRSGPFATMYGGAQEMGRMDRDGRLAAGDNRYEVHLSFPCFVSLYARCKQQKDPLGTNRGSRIFLTGISCSMKCPTSFAVRCNSGQG